MSTNHAKCALITPEPYQGFCAQPGEDDATWSIIEAATYADLPPLIVRRGNWVVCPDGIHTLMNDYYISKSRLDEADWIEHMSEKAWVDMEEFRAIYSIARSMVELGMI